MIKKKFKKIVVWCSILFISIIWLGAARFAWSYLLPLSTFHTTTLSPVDASTTNTEDSEMTSAEPLPTNVKFSLPLRTLSGLPIVSASSIDLGTTIAKTGEAGLCGRALSDGVFLYLTKANTDGGVWKKIRISLDQRDDSGIIARATPHLYDLLSKTPFFFSVMGEVVFEKLYLPLLKKNAAALLFPAVGMREGVTPELPIVWYRPPYRLEVAALLHYAVNTRKQTKIALFYEESAWGIEAKNAAEELLRNKYATAPCAVASYQPNTVIIQQAVSLIKKSEPKVVLCLSSGRPTYNFIREAINQQMQSVAFLGLSRVAHIAPQLKKSRGVLLVTTSVVPNPYNSKLPIVQEYRTLMQQYLPNKGLSTDSLEGFIAGSLLGYFLEQSSQSTTVTQLLNKITQTRPLIFKGLALQYKEQTLSWSVWLNTGIESAWHEYSDR